MYRLSGEEGILGAIEKHELDVIVGPTKADPVSTFTARLGLPAITVPMGFFPEGTPIRKSKRGDVIEVAPKCSVSTSTTSNLGISLTFLSCGLMHEGLEMVVAKDVERYWYAFDNEQKGGFRSVRWVNSKH